MFFCLLPVYSEVGDASADSGNYFLSVWYSTTHIAKYLDNEQDLMIITQVNKRAASKF